MKVDFIFRVAPYVAAVVLVLGLLVRYALARRRMDALSGELADIWALFRGGLVWRVSLVLLLVAHLVGLVFPRVILGWDTSAPRLYLLEGAGYLLGAGALVGWAVVAWRHLGRTASASSPAAEVADSIFLALLLVSIGSGLLMAVAYRWASAWGAVTLSPYLASLFGGEPVDGLASQMPFLVQLHVFSAFALLAALPFTRLAPFFIVALDRALVLAARPFAAASRSGEAWLRKHNPAVWIWPEED
jgi:nitrate reductase gamma subunit